MSSLALITIDYDIRLTCILTDRANVDGQTY